MRGLLKFLACIAVLAGFYYGHRAMDTHRIKNDSYPFVAGALKAIADGWKPEVFLKYSADSLKDSKDIPISLAHYRALGPLEGEPDCDLEDFTSYLYKGTTLTYVAVNYECKARFEKAAADIQLTVYRFTDKADWKIQYFTLSSPYFEPQPKNGK